MERNNLDLVLIVAAFLCFAFAAFGVVKSERVNLIALGLAFAVLTYII